MGQGFCLAAGLLPGAISRRTLLLTIPAFLQAKSSGIRVGAQTTARTFEALLPSLTELKQAGFEGFETSSLAVRSEFDKPDPAYQRLHKIGLRFLGIQISLKTYDPQTAIASWALIQQAADAAKPLEAERLILTGASTFHPLALKAKADALTRAAKYCKGIGVGLAYQTGDFDFQEQATQLEGLLAQTDPNVYFILDAADPTAFFLKNWKRIDAIRLQADNDYTPLAKAIQATSWKGWLIAEGPETQSPAREAIRKIFAA